MIKCAGLLLIPDILHCESVVYTALINQEKSINSACFYNFVRSLIAVKHLLLQSCKNVITLTRLPSPLWLHCFFDTPSDYLSSECIAQRNSPLSQFSCINCTLFIDTVKNLSGSNDRISSFGSCSTFPDSYRNSLSWYYRLNVTVWF